MARAFFLGAGASRADGYPLTKHLMCGAVNAAVGDPERYDRTLDFLRNVFRLAPDELHEAAALWDQFVESPEDAADPSFLRVPDVVELLSLLDVLVAEESTVAGKQKPNGHVEAYGARELSRVKEGISRAVAASLAALARARKGDGSRGHTARLVAELQPDDVVITTNWDLLLDRALHFRYGTDSASIGSDVIVTDLGGDAMGQPQRLDRPPLFKLHGSLNWLMCLRCTRLFVNPTYHTADLGFLRSARGEANSCDCGMPLRAALITPTFFKQYRNRHLANVWANAQDRLARTSQWYFIGYSLPADDVHIRALLLRAFHMRSTHEATEVVVVRDGPDRHMEARYRRLFRNVRMFTEGFEQFVPHLRSSSA